MKTNIKKTFRLDQPIHTAWEFLSDPNSIVGCVPGAKITETIDDQNYKGSITMKIGPVVSSFNGQITITQMNPDDHTMEMTGKGTDTKGKGSAGMVLMASLSDLGDNTTEVQSDMEVSITGKLAQFGSRMIVDVSNQVFKQFENNLRHQLAATAQQKDTDNPAQPAESKPVNAVSLLFSSIWSFILRLFGKSSS